MKYIYAKDRSGEVLGALQPVGDPLTNRDRVCMNALAMRNKPTVDWEKFLPDGLPGLFLDLNKCEEYKIYDSYEEFCGEYIDALI